MYKVTTTDNQGYTTIQRFSDIVDAGLWFAFSGESGNASVMSYDGIDMTFCYVDGKKIVVQITEDGASYMHTIPYPTTNDVK